MSKPETMSEWVRRRDEWGVPDAREMADGMSTADLFKAFAECAHHSNGHGIDQLGWGFALDAVCEALGKRVDGAYSRGMR